MAVSLELPDLGAGPQGGLVAEWYQPDGASVKAGELVCRVESDFIAYELEATQPGVLRHRLGAGATGPVGTPLGVILAHGETIDSPSLVVPPAKRPPKAAAVPPERPPAREPETVEAAPGEVDESVDGRDGRHPREAERVVLPFPRRFANVPALDWDTVPGDAVEFSSALLGEQPGRVTAELEEPGGVIPGLPLWAPDEDPPMGHAYPPPPVETSAPAVETVVETRPIRAAQVLSVTVELDFTEAAKMAAALARAPGGPRLDSRVEDVLFHGIALALDDAGRGGGGLFTLAGAHEEISAAIAAPSRRTIRDTVAVRTRGGEAGGDVEVRWTLLSVADLAVKSATPKLERGLDAAFCVGTADANGVASVTMAVDGGAWSVGEAARLLARVRELVEAPYAMLV